jgi:hypothetical protein
MDDLVGLGAFFLFLAMSSDGNHGQSDRCCAYQDR